MRGEPIPLYDFQVEPPPEWAAEMERQFQERLAKERNEDDEPRVIVFEI